MKKLESTLKNMALALGGITVVSVGLLAWVNQITKDAIAEASIKAKSEAVSAVIPGFNNDPLADKTEYEYEGTTYTVYQAKRDGEFIGAAVESAAMGFGGRLSVMVGFDKEGRILDYSLLTHSETPGLGAKADAWFKKGGKGDITGMNPGAGKLSVSKDGGQVDAITASTITSRAFLQAVNAAYAVYEGQNADAVSGATSQNK